MKRIVLSPGAKLRARSLAWKLDMQADSEAIDNTGTGKIVAAELREIVSLLTQASGRPGSPADGRELHVLDVMQHTGWSQMRSCRWVLAQRDADGQPTPEQIDAVGKKRVEALSKAVTRLKREGMLGTLVGTFTIDPPA